MPAAILVLQGFHERWVMLTDGWGEPFGPVPSGTLEME
jgi:hypothetical protein